MDDERDDRFRGPWFDAKTAAAYIPCKNVRAFYAWRKRHGIIKRANNSVAKADLDRALKRTGPEVRGSHPNSRLNLERARLRRARVA